MTVATAGIIYRYRMAMIAIKNKLPNASTISVSYISPLHFDCIGKNP